MGSFDVIIAGFCSTVTSSAVTLTVSELPEIITQPAAATVCAGENAVFTADAGLPPIRFISGMSMTTAAADGLQL